MNLTSLPKWFEKRVEFEPNTGCWLWVGSRHKKGYGLMGPYLAHRIVYEALVGPIPKDKEIDHLCRVRCCVNPKHLEAVSHLVNVQRGTNFYRNKTHCPRGHVYDVVRKDGGRMCRECHAKQTLARWRAKNGRS